MARTAAAESIATRTHTPWMRACVCVCVCERVGCRACWKRLHGGRVAFQWKQADRQAWFSGTGSLLLLLLLLFFKSKPNVLLWGCTEVKWPAVATCRGIERLALRNRTRIGGFFFQPCRFSSSAGLLELRRAGSGRCITCRQSVKRCTSTDEKKQEENNDGERCGHSVHRSRIFMGSEIRNDVGNRAVNQSFFFNRKALRSSFESIKHGRVQVVLNRNH